MAGKLLKRVLVVVGFIGGICALLWLVTTGKFSAASRLASSLFNRDTRRDMERDKERDQQFVQSQQRVDEGADRIEDASREIIASGTNAIKHIGNAQTIADRSKQSIQRLEQLIQEAEQKSK